MKDVMEASDIRLSEHTYLKMLTFQLQKKVASPVCSGSGRTTLLNESRKVTMTKRSVLIGNIQIRESILYN